jgi:hypothetical protein
MNEYGQSLQHFYNNNNNNNNNGKNEVQVFTAVSSIGRGIYWHTVNLFFLAEFSSYKSYFNNLNSNIFSLSSK